MKFKNLVVLLLFSWAISAIGCGSSDDDADITQGNEANPTFADSSLTAFEAAKLAAEEKRWSDAKSLIRDALIEDASNPGVLQLAASITNADGDQNTAIDYIAEASIADGFRDEQLVGRAVIGFVSIGKIYEAIEFLEQVVEAFPNRSLARRQLFDFLVNVEETDRAIPHGRRLVRERQFNRVLLFSLSTHEKRDMETDSMALLSQRNPSDQRLRIAGIQSRFDLGKWDELEEELDAVLKQHSDSIAAQLLLGRYYVANNQIDQLASWSKRLSPAVSERWQYWDIVGDWSFDRQEYPQAARAYWESTRRNLDVGEVFGKLTKTLGILSSRGEPVGEGVIDAVQKRAQLLGRFTHEKDRFYKTGNQSGAIAGSIAESLAALGRYWEAEAWAAIAMTITISDDEMQTVKSIREQILKRLRTAPPWQVAEGHPAVELDLSQFPAPKTERLASKSVSAPLNAFRPSVTPALEDQAVARGIVDSTQQNLEPSNEAIPLFAQMESGGCSIDFDRDGWPDLYIAESGGTPGQADSKANQLLRNRNGQFDEVTMLAGVADSGFAQGVTFGDVNEDGFSDLVVLNYGTNRLFINNGDGTYSENKRWIKDAESSWSTSGAIADIDGDGLSDFVCLKYCTPLDPLQRTCSVPGTEMIEYCTPTDFEADADQFFRGQPEGSWMNVDESWNAVPTNPGRGLGVVVGEFDNAPGIDVYVSNDMTSNHFWSVGSQQPFSIQESGTIRGLALDGRSRPQASMGIAVADFDTDDDIDLLVTNFEAEHNTLYDQVYPGYWEDKSRVAGVLESSFAALGFGAQAVDFDNDSQLELIVTNGHVHHNATSGYEQQPQVLRRVESGEFEVIASAKLSQYFRDRHVGRALVSLDIDRDHLMDLVVTHQSESTALLHNETADTQNNHWLRVTLVGKDSARDAIGSTVTVSCGETRRMATVLSGHGFFCSSEDALHFGFGSSTGRAKRNTDVQIDIRWPGGSTQTYHANLDQECLIVEGQEDVYVYP